MEQSIGDLLKEVMNHPAVRAGTIVISLLSLVIAYVSFRRTNQAVQNYWRNSTAEHGRYLEGQWRDLYQLTFTSSEFAQQTATMFGHPDAERAKREAALLMYVNLCSVAYDGHRRGVIDRATLDGHMGSFFGHYKGDPVELQRLLDLSGYEAGFRAECMRHLKRSATLS